MLLETTAAGSVCWCGLVLLSFLSALGRILYIHVVLFFPVTSPDSGGSIHLYLYFELLYFEVLIFNLLGRSGTDNG